LARRGFGIIGTVLYSVGRRSGGRQTDMHGLGERGISGPPNSGL